jgi:hypothetical protein
MAEIKTLFQSGRAPFKFSENGEFLLSFKGSVRNSFAASFKHGDPAVLPQGILEFDFEGNDANGEMSMDLAASDNSFSTSVAVPNLHLKLTGLPPEASIFLYCA